MTTIKFTGKLSVPVVKIKEEEIRIFRKKAERAIEVGTDRAAGYIKSSLQIALTSALKAKQWQWPRETIRKNGSTAGTVRDIVDTGTLLSSQELTHTSAKTKATIKITYTAPHAAITYYGGAIKPYGNPNASTVLIPGRPWVEAILNGTHGFTQFDINKFYQKGMQEAWKEIMQ